ncbi:MAG: stage III sporulation protein AG [Blautia sp.]|nr:stage III sporulation protein AG [Blautia sp.]
MINFLEKWRKNTDFKKWFKKDNLIILILAGVLLVIIALPTKDNGETKTDPPQAGEAPDRDPENNGTAATDAEPVDTDQEYAAQLEQRLREILTGMEGVGKVRVMITLKSSRELVVEKEQPFLRSSTNENDAQGGNRSVNQLESQDNTVYRTDGSVSEPYVIKTLPPQVEGVVVVAEGAGSGTINRTIVELVQTLFGVEAHKVKVVKMEPAE